MTGIFRMLMFSLVRYPQQVISTQQ